MRGLMHGVTKIEDKKSPSITKIIHTDLAGTWYTKSKTIKKCNEKLCFDFSQFEFHFLL